MCAVALDLGHFYPSTTSVKEARACNAMGHLASSRITAQYLESKLMWEPQILPALLLKQLLLIIILEIDLERQNI